MPVTSTLFCYVSLRDLFICLFVCLCDLFSYVFVCLFAYFVCLFAYFVCLFVRLWHGLRGASFCDAGMYMACASVCREATDRLVGSLRARLAAVLGERAAAEARARAAAAAVRARRGLACI